MQAQLDELAAAYKKAHKVELADQIDKKCSGDLKQLMLAKLGKGKDNLGLSVMILKYDTNQTIFARTALFTAWCPFCLDYKSEKHCKQSLTIFHRTKFINSVGKTNAVPCLFFCWNILFRMLRRKCLTELVVPRFEIF